MMVTKAVSLKEYYFNLRYAKPVFPWIASFINRCFLSTAVSSEEELLDIFHPPKSSDGEKDDTSISYPEKKALRNKTSKDLPVIECKRPEFNHFRNQKYDKFTPIPLASKGWHHYKSKGDYFTINICQQENYVKNWFWGEEDLSFRELGLCENLVSTLEVVGFKKPSKLQIETIPKVLKGRNCLLTAETGCGKTLGFLLPAIQQVLDWKNKLGERPLNTPLVLILTPSRELASQIYEVAKELSYHLPFSCRCLIGGRTKRKMVNPQFSQVDILVSSLGAMSKLTTTGIFNVSEVRHLILDEADTLLDDSFNELLVRYLKKFKIRLKPEFSDTVPDNTQLTLSSATFPTSLYTILEGFVEPDSLVKLSTGREHRILPYVPQTFYRIGGSEKPSKLLYLVKDTIKKKIPMIIFSNRSKTCDWLSFMLNENGVKATHLNGDMPYMIRRDRFELFQTGEVDVLSTTDIASRGLDTIRARHVLNFDFPLYMADYIHRCGRTGRIGSHLSCLVTNFVSGDREVDLVNKIELAVRTMNELPNVNANITKIIHHRIMKMATAQKERNC